MAEKLPTMKQIREFCAHMTKTGDWRIVYEGRGYYTVYFCLSIGGFAFQLMHGNTLNICKKLCVALMDESGFKWRK